jgi:hypothetical protein
MSLKRWLSLALGGTLIVLVGVSATNAVRLRRAKERALRAKLEQVHEDLYLLTMASLEHWHWHANFYPVPDWVRELPYDDILEWTYDEKVFPTKEEYLRGDQESVSGVFINDFKLFTEFWIRRSGGKSNAPPQGYDLPDRDSPTIGRTKDRFDQKGRVYGYARSRDSLCMLIFSSGPDGQREINPRLLVCRPPHYGFDRPLVELSYDPTNGLISRGDIFALEPDEGEGILPEFRKKKTLSTHWDKP